MYVCVYHFLLYCPIKGLDSSFVNKLPTLMSIDAVILPLMVLIVLVIGGNCWPLSDRAFNDRLSPLGSKRLHHLQPYNYCDLNITSKKEQCHFKDRNTFSASNKQHLNGRLAYRISSLSIKSLFQPASLFNSALCTSSPLIMASNGSAGISSGVVSICVAVKWSIAWPLSWVYLIMHKLIRPHFVNLSV